MTNQERTSEQLISELRKVARQLHDHDLIGHLDLGTALGIADRADSSLQQQRHERRMRLSYPNEIQEKGDRRHYINHPQSEKRGDPMDKPIHQTYGEKSSSGGCRQLVPPRPDRLTELMERDSAERMAGRVDMWG